MRYAALLRGINVGGNKLIPMADLRAMAEAMGFTGVQTLLQSGNMVFEAKSQPTAKLEKLLEVETKKHCGVETFYYVRSAPEWKAIMAANPFPDAAKDDPSHLLVKFERDAPATAAVKALRESITGREEMRVVGREWYVTYPDGIGNSKLATTRAGRAYSSTGTARNWNTVLKIATALGL